MKSNNVLSLLLYYSLAGYSWSSFFSSIQKDLEEIRTAVTEGATELMTYVKESIPETDEQPSPTQSSDQLEIDPQEPEVPSHQEVEEKSLAGRLTGFLSSTFNKTKQLLSEALEEDEDPDTSYVNCQLPFRSREDDVRDDQEVYRVLNTTETTYTTITDDEADEFGRWMDQRDRVYLYSLKKILIKEHPIIQVMYSRLVPTTLSDTSFWNHYFFHMEKQGYDFSHYHQENISTSTTPLVDVSSSLPEPSQIGRILFNAVTSSYKG